MARRQPAKPMAKAHPWELDRRVPIALIIALAMQFGAGVWGLSSSYSRLGTLEEWAKSTATQGDRLVRVEEKLAAISEQMGEIKTILRQSQVAAIAPMRPTTR